MTSQSPSSSPEPSSSTTMTRWYIDTRPLTSSGTSSLPLLETLQPADQETIKKYYHLTDRHMSLASYLLKYLFIHRACRVPWGEITISRTPEPHRRPCFIPPPSPSASRGSEDGDGECVVPSVEFNVSHQASLVALAGCIVPSSSSSSSTILHSHPSPSPPPSASQSTTPQLGIDVTCTNEPFRPRRKDSIPRTRKQLADFVDIFSEVFSRRELDTIKTTPIPASASQQLLSSKEEEEEKEVKYRYRLFYTYWALKEAYIKMTGEALLAPWLRELEFRNVAAPEPILPVPASTTTTRDGAGDNPAVWGTPYTGIQTFLHGKKVDDVRIEVVAFEKDYLVATAARGAGFGAGSGSRPAGMDRDPWAEFRRIEIERDVGPCARGECGCLKDSER
ncbi:hypothetical protein VTN00DRAFT_2617 [Thermoascus crustaceus]|uniref:uncharacterized protein n=1 Tax=Thermoascus crustaceus TaxID=5088 RepID=UPI0037422036